MEPISALFAEKLPFDWPNPTNIVPPIGRTPSNYPDVVCGGCERLLARGYTQQTLAYTVVKCECGGYNWMGKTSPIRRCRICAKQLTEKTESTVSPGVCQACADDLARAPRKTTR